MESRLNEENPYLINKDNTTLVALHIDLFLGQSEAITHELQIATEGTKNTCAPSPTYFCESSVADNLMKAASVSFAQARAKRVLPVPGGP